MGLGELFKKSRLAKGITLEEVEEETKVRKQFIEALENEDFAILPVQIYATGFVKLYARFLRLNQQYMADLFMHQAYGKPKPPEPDKIDYSEPGVDRLSSRKPSKPEPPAPKIEEHTEPFPQESVETEKEDFFGPVRQEIVDSEQQRYDIPIR